MRPAIVLASLIVCAGHATAQQSKGKQVVVVTVMTNTATGTSMRSESPPSFYSNPKVPLTVAECNRIAKLSNPEVASMFKGMNYKIESHCEERG